LYLDESEINELRSKYFSIDFDPSISFRNELYQSIKQLRLEYQLIIQNKKDYLHNQFNIYKQQIHYQYINFNKDQQQINKLNQIILEIKTKNIYLKEKNQQLNNQINQFQTSIKQLKQIS